jgi:hypothetical protein
MTKVTVDAATKERLHAPGEVLEVCDEAGRTLGFFHPICEDAPAAGGATRSPFTREELVRRKEQRSGRPLQEILKGLEQQ